MGGGGERAQTGEGSAALSREGMACLGQWGQGPSSGAQGQLHEDLRAEMGLVRVGKGWQGSGWRGQHAFRQAASDEEEVMSQG